ncbi:MAG: LacI family DNA-binding transcriptional regulator [Candidatus Promineifilaceae bacterium]
MHPHPPTPFRTKQQNKINRSVDIRNVSDAEKGIFQYQSRAQNEVTLKEVAKKSGMSVITVSRALNGFDDVAADTRAFIQATADALGYTPNLNARRLKTQRADAIGLIIPNENLRFSDPFFSELFSGIIEQCATYGLELNVTTPTPSENIEEVYPQRHKYLAVR